LGFRDGESDEGVDAGLDAGLDADLDADLDAGDDAPAEPLGLGEPDGADALQSSTVTVHVAFADPMLR
jgi:hypothetical protein